MGGARGKESIRAFVALDLDSTSLRRVARVADRLRMASGAPSATWTQPGKMHVTLKFIETLPADASVALGKSLEALATGKPAPALGPLRLEAFPSIEAARVVLLELADTDGGVAALAGRVEKLALRHGIPKEQRRFRPHVTLARLKMQYDARRWLKAELADGAADCRAVRLTLYRSELTDAGSAYVPLATFDFGAA